MMQLTEAAEAMNAVASGVDSPFSGVSIDSRSVRQGDLFVAIPGERFDGHHFIEAARRSGAVAALVSHDADTSDIDPAFNLLRVRDTTQALGLLATHWRQKFSIPVLGITGSNGKTTVTAMVRQILSVRHQPLAPRQSFNNQWGVPLTLLDLHPGHTHAVIEMGMNHRGEIDYLTRIAQPTIALINNAAAAHLEGLGSVREVALAKAEILNGMRDQGTFVLNADDEHAALWRELAGEHQVIEFSATQETTVCAHDIDQQADSVEFVLVADGESATLRLPVPGLHNVRNSLAAAAVCHAAEVDLSTIVAGLQSFEAVAGRLRRIHSPGGGTLIDDSFNANPGSIAAAIDVLASQSGRTVLVLGAMAELGKDECALHREIGERASKAGIDRLLALGDSGNAAVADYVAGFGVDGEVFCDLGNLMAALEPENSAGVTILVKGSKSSGMGRVVYALRDGAGARQTANNENNNQPAEATC